MARISNIKSKIGYFIYFNKYLPSFLYENEMLYDIITVFA